MTDSALLFLVPTVVAQAFFIWLAYQLVGAVVFSRPSWVFFAGLVFMAFAALSKAALLPLASMSNPILSSIPTAITIIEVSTAAIGGSLVAAAFVLKAQILHNTWILRAEEGIADLRERLAYIQEGIAKLKEQRDSMAVEEFDEKLEALRRRESDRKEKLERLEEEFKKRSII